ncbi:MAG: UDP-N-acetylmuramate--L-alanine ligase [Treponema sp.]|jgi:UDP-N-acetylmuramate--alanine ligase|nr:UDP-N-acetylmuramate--L-alanine ligase [Treponema sp.]
MGIEEIIRPGASVYFVGIKGTGVCALAELMHEAGMKVTGSDTPEVFYTDAILQKLHIPYYQKFDSSHITGDIDILIHSAAYSADSNPEMARALRLNIPVIKYPDALGAWSAKFDSAGICGVHGKTTTTAIAGVIARSAGLPAQVLAGSAVADFSGRSTLILGSKYFIAETCEYRRHFLSFHPKHIVLTAVESDHQDCFPDYESIRGAFIEYCRLLPPGGELIYCADDKGACEVARFIEKENRSVTLIPYGFAATGDYQITSYNVKNEKAVFTLAGFSGEFIIKIPGRHQALNVAAALALTHILADKEFDRKGTLKDNEKLQAIKTAVENFKGSKRRSEIIGEAGGVIFMDDYGHHPTAIKTTLAGIRSFYPSRRLVVSFMSHTYSRTTALLDDFAAVFGDADFLFLHKIYASAREKYDGGVDGRTLYEKIAAVRGEDTIRYIDEPLDAFDTLCGILKPGDIFITVGAGNNWPLSEKLFAHFKSIKNAGDRHD